MIDFIWNISFISDALEMILFYLFFKKYGDIELILGSGIIVGILDLIFSIITTIIMKVTMLNSNLNVELAFGLITLILMVFFVKRFGNKFKIYLSNQNKNIFLGVLIYLYVSSAGVSFLYLLDKRITPFTLFFTIFVIVQSVFAIGVYGEMVYVQNKLLTQRKQQEIRQKQRQLEEYADYLEKSEDDLRAFRHDYKNILNSLKVSAQEGNVQEVIQKLDKYTETNLNSDALLKYKDVNHIHIKSIKSIIISKLTEMYNLNIPYNFECRSGVYNLPNEIDELDLVRIIGITFDNAIEESKALVAEKHKIRSADVQIMVYSDEPGEFEYEIRNKIQNQKISTTQIQQRGFTTKKNHKGLGLANIKEIENKYPDMSISYTIQDGWFDFYMVIDTEDGEKDG
ncbi:GHKL domain-containing protein [Lactobacillus crispatus]|nr:GHKL domain-containing protein [Lactobacillus crispatus]